MYLDMDFVRVLLNIVSGKSNVDELQESTGIQLSDLSSILKTMSKMGWITRTKNKEVSLNISLDEVADIVRMGGSKITFVDVPFRSKMYVRKSYRFVRIPQYIVNAFNLDSSKLLVLNINGVRVFGSIGSDNLFYIYKRYWDAIGDFENCKEVEVLLESYYSPDKLSKTDRKVINIPFKGKVYFYKHYVVLRIPQYIVRTFGIKPRQLLVLKINGSRISGTISSSKNIFYIHKMYRDDLEVLNKGKEIDVILESYYQPAQD